MKIKKKQIYIFLNKKKDDLVLRTIFFYCIFDYDFFIVQEKKCLCVENNKNWWTVLAR